MVSNIAVRTAPSKRRFIVHVGTHKTGTTALQNFLAVNAGALGRAGIHYPFAARYAAGPYVSSGHHQLAFDLRDHAGSARKPPGLAAMIEEIAFRQAPTVIVSSEELLPLTTTPHALGKLTSIVRTLGYEPLAVIVLRAQPDYLESLYAELSASCATLPSFPDAIAEALAEQRLAPPGDARSFDLRYSALIASLEAIFGIGNVVARAYRPDAGPAFGRTDFLDVVGRVHGTFTVRGARDPMPRANERKSLRTVLTNLVRMRGADRDVDLDVLLGAAAGSIEPSELDRPFTFLQESDRRRLLPVFAAQNAALNAVFDIAIPFTSEHDISMTAADDERARAHRAVLDIVWRAIW